MSPEDSHHQTAPTTEVKPAKQGASAPVPAGPMRMPKINLSRTSSAFVAEYSIMLVMLTIALGGLSWLFYIFGGLILSSMQGTSFANMSLLVLWVATTSLVALPATAIFWSRTQGEIATTYNGDIPKGGARGFRTFWLVASGVSVLLMLAGAVYAPIATTLEGSNGFEVVLGVSLPSLLSAATVVAGIILVTSMAARRRLVRMLMWVIAIATAVFIITDYAWAINMHETHTTTPTRYTPNQTTPYYEYDSPYNSYPYTN